MAKVLKRRLRFSAYAQPPFSSCYYFAMARRRRDDRFSFVRGAFADLRSETSRTIVAVAFAVFGIFLSLSAVGLAGVGGEAAYRLFARLLGAGYFLLPLSSFAAAVLLIRNTAEETSPLKLIALTVALVSGLGLLSLVGNHGGVVGSAIASPLLSLFDLYASFLLLIALFAVSLLVLFNAGVTPEFFALFGRLLQRQKKREPTIVGVPEEKEEEEEGSEPPEEPLSPALAAPLPLKQSVREKKAPVISRSFGAYTPPPLSLLERDRGKPGVGDIKANANIIKRTFQNFGIDVEMDEISIGPSVTRYAIKPAEGVRLSKIVSLQNNLELALAAHPVRIEAPIPGKSLVGIEVPNAAKVTVGLATMFETADFQGAPKPLTVALGRDIAGVSHFANLAKMPHLLIAGATGAGKSVAIHVLINSLLYRNSPENLRLIMIDPKRVELTLYNGTPHLLTPVVTDAKKSIVALKWAAKEMDRRYDILEAESVRDIESYHQNIYAPAMKKKGPVSEEKIPEPLPYIIIVIDELADIMGAYPRELEAAVVRLAQMSRAVGIHLVLSTQRPSVNVITGLIKANIPARVALQVASQIDSRTILDGSGAEKLLGSGDMLYLSGDMAKPLRLQGPYIGETEVKKVVQFIASHNAEELPSDLGLAGGEAPSLGSDIFGLAADGDDDELYEEARKVVLEAGRASTSYLQRKLRIGYARAARLMDLLEEHGVIGPPDGARPREVVRDAVPTDESVSQ